MIGEHIAHYRNLEQLGEGGMGVVYRAHDTKLNRPVALKFLSARLGLEGDARARFFREAQAASALDHPNIGTVHDINETEDGRLYIALAYYEGPTLKQRIAEGPLPLDEALHLACQIGQGLARAHEAGIVHRDIKPANVLVTRGDSSTPWGLIKIVDFGLAKMRNTDLTGTGTTLGTVAYMSPEQARGEPVDGRTDVWSLGVVLYEMLTGLRPFRGDYPAAILYALANAEPDPVTTQRPDVPRALDAIVARALAKPVEARYPDMETMLSDLQAIQGVPPTRYATPVLQQEDHTTVGREKERRELRAGLDEAASGHGLLLCLTGEAGMGKTTLMDDFFQELARERTPCLVARGRSSERLASTEGYLPILEALESLLHGPAGSVVADAMRRLAPTWYVDLVSLNEDDPSDARVLNEAKATTQARKKREFVALLQEVCRIQPVLLFFDDLHWADISTVDLLAYVAGKCRSMALLIVVSYRPAELAQSDNQFAQVKLDLQARGISREIALAFLSMENVTDYLALEFPDHAFPETFARLIHSRTEGSPLFMTDLVRNLRDRDVITRIDESWVLSQSVSEIQGELPVSIRSMIQRKLDLVSPLQRRVLDVGAVQGAEFDSAVVAGVLELDPAEVEEELDKLARVHGLIRCTGDHEFPDLTLTVRYGFVHILYQNALYEALTRSRIRRLSLSVAEGLVGYHEDGEATTDIAADLAFLFEAGRDFARVSDFLMVAARNAAGLYATREAIALYERAVASAEKLKGEARTFRIFSVEMELGRLLYTTGSFDSSAASFEKAFLIAGEDGNTEGQIDALCAQALSYIVVGERGLEKGRTLGLQALDIARGADSSVGVAEAQVMLAIERIAIGDLDEVDDQFTQAIPVLREHVTPGAVLDPLAWYANMQNFRAEYGEARLLLDWSIGQARELGRANSIVQAQFILGMTLGNQGRLSDALSTLEEAARLADLIDAGWFQGPLQNTLGWIYSELEDIGSAQRLNTKSMELVQSMGGPEPGANAHVNLAHDMIRAGELDQAHEHLQAAERLFHTDKWMRWRYNIRLQAEFACYWIGRGDLEAAGRHASAAMEAATKTKCYKYVARAHQIRGDIAVLQDRVEEANTQYETARRLLREHPCPTLLWKVLKASAHLAGQVGDDAAREAHRREARSVVQSLAESVTDDGLRRHFLSSPAVQSI